MFFWTCFGFSMIQWMLAIWTLFLLPSLNPSGSSYFIYCWNQDWRIFSVTLLACKMCIIIQQFVDCLTLPFSGIGMKTDLFQSSDHCWIFQICWHTECSTSTASSFRILNSSAGIPITFTNLVCSKASWGLLDFTLGCQALGQWPHHLGYLVHWDLFL